MKRTQRGRSSREAVRGHGSNLGGDSGWGGQGGGSDLAAQASGLCWWPGWGLKGRRELGVRSWKPEFLRQEETRWGRCCRWPPIREPGFSRQGDPVHTAQLSRRPSRGHRVTEEVRVRTASLGLGFWRGWISLDLLQGQQEVAECPKQRHETKESDLSDFPF